MTSAAAEEWAPRRNVLWGSFNGLAYVPRLPPTAYTLLLHMMSGQEPGGLVVATHDELATGLAMERGMISRAMPHLVAARLVIVVRRGRFQLHPMIAAFNDPREQQRAVKALPRDMRLDVGDFEDEYERRFQHHLDEKARKAEAKAKGNIMPITKPTLLKRVH
ncbi:hypothetical protein [Streptomyces sp. NBC_00690]|uniref:hypothetical protein n=1 Tax=Streptomyces sp. NBC_00690 TaxID=2975808 RepID=UPI002E29BE18|nr:hypothetical protein [Streptomyces sp. NBC_00690]